MSVKKNKLKIYEKQDFSTACLLSVLSLLIGIFTIKDYLLGGIVFLVFPIVLFLMINSQEG